ncbi:hypothetical protein rpr22_0344 [Rickettsia prowazekii str. Rp22]|uniref:Uncharacterized protein n=1 Tax=Rickettsia prowazekii (strain Rp22) TaxID=449216 RepID=D5AWQ7_RICPP|nr:hypothetical protein rpr22_0344 [Rickettsia prowazekii str. Rp22]
MNIIQLFCDIANFIKAKDFSLRDKVKINYSRKNDIKVIAYKFLGILKIITLNL